MLIITDFLDDNANKVYPFTYHNSLPTSIIVDARFLVTENIEENALCIHSIEMTETHVRVELATWMDIEGVRTYVELGKILSVPIPDKSNTKLSCNLINNQYKVIIEGSITFGSFECIHGLSKYYQFDNTGSEPEGLLFENCVHKVTEWCTGLVINDTIYTGLVTLIADNGISFSTNGKGEIVISATGFQKPDGAPDTDTSEDIEDIVNKILSESGAVLSINGVEPDDKGEISLEIKDDSKDVLQIKSEEASVLTISKIDSKVCESSDGVVDGILSNIASLNERAGALQAFMQTLENNVNIISAQMTKVN